MALQVIGFRTLFGCCWCTVPVACPAEVVTPFATRDALAAALCGSHLLLNCLGGSASPEQRCCRIDTSASWRQPLPPRLLRCRYPHVYVPLVPAALTDLLDAPTPFLMGLGGGLGAALAAELHAACAGACGGVPGAGGGGGSGGDGEFSEWFGGGVAARVAEGLVVADLDRCDLAGRHGCWAHHIMNCHPRYSCGTGMQDRVNSEGAVHGCS